MSFERASRPSKEIYHSRIDAFVAALFEVLAVELDAVVAEVLT
jgi:hypothetical protein